ncbi:sulfite exporter TauE/SafE family protein [Solicola gregarius]|uniref:Probable membrane transporter protein n=1 Tax=Solicola gregarius TaxID=2908642 RepID=A0AA46TJV1_9ACTN|nr:sulfite exporter TauE/SafE family protein [Solicola gregarius]UYM06214.1 sulfite exporter TauE/SafE family protein [Solicola gregarius]
MSPIEMLLVLVAGVGAGTINTVVGSGTLITFPTLVAVGVPPVSATMSNALGLIPGGVSGSLGYRRELVGQGRRLARLVPMSMAGALVGAFLLLHLPEEAFEAIVPTLIVVALVLVLIQPLVQRSLRRRRGDAPPADDGAAPGIGRRIAISAVVFGCAVYGGYFAAAQGILLMGLLGLLVSDPMQRLNGFKNVLVLTVNSVAATTYLIVGWSSIHWDAVALIAVGSMTGGYVGARIGRRLHPVALRACIVALGVIAIWRMAVT